MESISVRFVKERETKNTIRFQEDHPETEPAKVGTVYVQKHALAQLGHPEEIEVKITPEGR